MLNWLHTLSNFHIGILIVSLGLAVSTVVPFLIRWKFALAPGEHLAKGAEESFKLFTSVTMLLLAFCLVRVQGDHRSVEDLVAREATIIFKLNRALAGFGGDDALGLRENLKLYAVSTVNDEWPLLARGQRSEATSDLLTILVQGCRQLDPKTPLQQLARAEVLGTLTQMSDVREARLSASRLFLPLYFWQALLSAITLLTVFGWLQSPLPKMFAYVGGVTLGVSLLLTVLITTEGIFVGESRVTAEAIARIVPSLSE
jgi:hypothetical protein